jgi:hypothetical protein
MFAMSGFDEEVEEETTGCGCYSEYINGKHINILCDEHEQEYQEMQIAPLYFQKTKMRRGWDL